MQIWVFVIATLIAVIGIVFQFKKLMSEVARKLDNNEEVTTQTLQKENNRFFIKVVMIEAIPIMLVVLGFILIESIQSPLNLIDILPALVILGITFLAGVVNVFMGQKQIFSERDVTSQAKAAITSMTFVGVSLIAAFPIISFVAMFTLLTS
ncbi:hypothetical protein [Halalkalibacter okhensis]|uniref:Uncharacterized protein n=1 Tax=Halalkalibacter okhensis TaxID=333138 RepID=A0A0B0IJX0_9BACI|nr:hypothetical protein [Halalkalibacter okhensis]KHF39956.1 hypothetical protein LQ50_11725 [Halalkalibacter okhensis]